MRNFLTAVSLLAALFILAANTAPSAGLSPESDVAQILQELGAAPSPFAVKEGVANVSVENGEQLVLEGFSKIGGRKQSKHFVCTSCHNIEREDPDLSKSDPQARLLYAKERGLPFLQGTTLYGVVNRKTFYNGDYEQKYGDLVEKARNDLREAIQLCAVECSQGRALEPSEMESVVAYLWTIGLKMKDLNLSSEEYSQIDAALADQPAQGAARALIASKFLSGSPATFVKPPDNRKTGYGLQGDPTNGKLVYDLGCKHCHENKRYSFYNLDDASYSFKHLDRHFTRYTRYSTYQVSRYGTSPTNGKKAYMPNYTLERMNHQQIEDLRAYIEGQAR